MNNIYICARVALFLALISITGTAFGQSFDRIERSRTKDILRNIKNEIKQNYYDEKFHGIDVEARFEKADKRLDEVNSLGQAYAVIAQVLIEFEDSHLFFSPPATNVRAEYGFRMKMIGEQAFVTSVKPKSDAENKGLRAGDRILSIEGFKPKRKDLWKMIYYYYTLSPRAKMRLDVVHAGANAMEKIEFATKIKTGKRKLNYTNTFELNDAIRESDDYYRRTVHYFLRTGNIVIWKMTTFSFDPTQVGQFVNSELKKGENVIIDLRGNGGGYIKTLEELVGYFTKEDTKIADRKGRAEKKKENEPMLAKSKGKDVYKGKLTVLIDSQSGSASEMFARWVQLSKRGVVMGDLSAGAVMQSMSHPLKLDAGINEEIYYGVSITNADVIMQDGKSLEHIGVTPDELIVPTAEDLAKRRDPVLARAIEFLGGKVSPEQAATLFAKADEWDDNN